MNAPKIFRLLERTRVMVSGVAYVHARLQTCRLGKWTVVGVFQMTDGEWNALVACCDVLGIEVGQDVEEPAVSS